MRGATHAWTALACATVLPDVAREAAAGRPGLVLLAVVSGLLPDLLERLRRAGRPAEVTIVPDPLALDPQLLVEGVALAAARAAADPRPCTLRLVGLPDAAKDAPNVGLALDTAPSRITARVGRREATHALPRCRPAWPSRWEVARDDFPLVRFRRAGGAGEARIESDLDLRDWPHSPLFLVAVACASGLLGGARASGVAVLALGSHALLDQGGLCGLPWDWPRRGTRPTLGWRWWHGRAAGANATVSALAGLLLMWNLFQNTAYLPWRPSWWLVALAASAIGVLAWRSQVRARSSRIAGNPGRSRGGTQ